MLNNETKKTTICLNMIVKNEAHVIERCLKSVIPYIDTWIISDTGSNDGTQELVREIMKDIPGELLQREWKNFGHNRNEVLQHAKGKADYSLVIDADEWLECEEKAIFQNLSADSYFITKSQINKQYLVRNIIRNDMDWEWEGVLHECLDSKTATTSGTINGAVIQARQEGARALDPDTYRRDAAILTTATLEEPHNSRYQFYLAQSWRDAEEYEFAILHYQRRIEMGGWHEEVFYSKYQIALLMEKLERNWNECMAAYLDAWSHTPLRAEPLFRIGIHYMDENNWEVARLFFLQAVNIRQPESLILFIEEEIYKTLALFNATVAAGNTGRYNEYRDLYQKLIAIEELEEGLKARAIKNHSYFMEKMAERTILTA